MILICTHMMRMQMQSINSVQSQRIHQAAQALAQTMSPQTSLLLSSLAMVTLVCVVIIVSYHGHGLQNTNDNITEIVLANDQGRFNSSLQ